MPTGRGRAEAKAAQALADGLVIDALVVDFRLRDETGVDVIARLRSLRPGKGIAVLHKPVDGARLARALVQAVRHPLVQQGTTAASSPCG